MVDLPLVHLVLKVGHHGRLVGGRIQQNDTQASGKKALFMFSLKGVVCVEGKKANLLQCTVYCSIINRYTQMYNSLFDLLILIYVFIPCSVHHGESSNNIGTSTISKANDILDSQLIQNSDQILSNMLYKKGH